MDASIFNASTSAIGPFFAELTAAGFDDCPMSTLRQIGLRAESAMLLATGGINTHRGAIFGLACFALRLERFWNVSLEQ